MTYPDTYFLGYWCSILLGQVGEIPTSNLQCASWLAGLAGLGRFTQLGRRVAIFWTQNIFFAVVGSFRIVVPVISECSVLFFQSFRVLLRSFRSVVPVISECSVVFFRSCRVFLPVISETNLGHPRTHVYSGVAFAKNVCWTDQHRRP